ncbi:DNA-directed RNA polymerase II subunit RPB1-like [Limulus polyphemus]|uniref:DNA-directed RNA polymerase II subunit RPB1-like n=1 Tax=Limulus polyphemus TaxID=6850 RepID=A0ABM1SVK2_LIMPO|nr:DNA-directed RNA polymerase II subunit RPB1-like [Limulus polyphemus]
MGFFANRRNQCPICKISYTNKSILENHMNMHRPQRQMYYCDICNKGFFWRTNVYSHKRMVHHTPPLRLPFPATSNAPVSPKSNQPFPSIPHSSNPLSPQSPSFAQLASHRTPPSTPLPPAFPGHMPQGSGLSSSCAEIGQSCALSDPANISPSSVSSVSRSCGNNLGHSLINHKQPPLSSTSLEKSPSSINLINAAGFPNIPQFPQPIGICSDPFPTMSPTISSLSLSSAYSPVLHPPAGSAASPAFSGQSQSTKSSESSEYSQLYSAASPDFFSDS